MKTELIEFFNSKKEILRGIAILPDAPAKKGALFLHGFERTATTEKKFKRLADELAERNIASSTFNKITQHPSPYKTSQRA